MATQVKRNQIDTNIIQGWIPANDTWTYASASSFTISGVDRTSIYKVGTLLKFDQSGTKYAVVSSSSFSTNTTVNIIVNTDYTIVNAAITLPYFSYQKPPDFPVDFAFTPTTNGFSSAPTGQLGSYTTNGRWMTVNYYEGANGTSNATSFTKNLPVACANIGTSVGIVGRCHGASDNGVYLTVTAGNGESPPTCFIVSGGSTVILSRAAGALNWTNSGNKGCSYLTITYPF